MPTQTFFNLPENKKNRVLEAAKKEFVRAEDGDIVIKNIVIDAQIPRGSFYQYFESKDDLVDFLMKAHMDENQEKFYDQIVEQNGDILAVFEKMFSNTISGKYNEKIDLEKKILDHVKKYQERRVNFSKKRPPQLFKNSKIFEYIDKSKYKVETSEDLESIFHILMGIMTKNIMAYKNGVKKEEALKCFKRDIEYLRHGIIK